MVLKKGDEILLRAIVKGFDGNEVLLDFSSTEDDPDTVKLSYSESEVFVKTKAIKIGIKNYKQFS